MPWVLIPGALRRLRRAKGWDRSEAAKRTGLDERTIHRHETDGLAPTTLQTESTRRYRLAYECEAKAFVRWADHDDEEAKRKPRTPRINDPAAPVIATLTERSKHELLIHGGKKIKIGDEEIEVVGNAIVQDCMTAFALHEGKRFAVDGQITDVRYLPEPAAKVLDAKLGEGASFRIDREIVKGLPVYVSVFTRSAAHTRHIMDCHKGEKNVTVVVRIFVKPPENDWKGFLIFEKKPKPRPWIYLVEEIVT